MKKFLWPLAMVLVIFAVITLSIQSKSNIETIENNYEQNFKQNYKIYNPPMPEKLDFAGEEVPLGIYYVAEDLEREILVNTYWHSNTLLTFKRANRWFAVMEPILKRNGIPDDFKYLAVIESGLMNITSPAGAKGFWQIMRSTAQDFGLESNRYVEERYHVEKATEAACSYLKQAYQKFNNWTLAAASYNMGMGGLNSRLTKQGETSYYDLSLNIETSRYLYRILALKQIFSHPQMYGFQLRQKDLYPALDYRVINVDTTIDNLSDFAHQQNCSYKMLKELNPWLLKGNLPNTSRKKYAIKIPNSSMYNYPKIKANLNEKLGIFGDRK